MMDVQVRPKTELVTYDAARALSKMLRERREKMGKTQLEVAADTGLKQQDVSTSERMNPLSGIRVFTFLTLLRYYKIEPNEAARTLGLMD